MSSQKLKYLNAYAAKNGVLNCIKFYHEVMNIVQNDDYDQTGRWKVTFRDMKTNEIQSEVFDGVMVATGHHVKPLVPTFPGQEKFKGKIIHTHSYKRPQGFEDQNIMVVGVGNSGGDAAVELSQVANQVYLSTRRGVWVIWRVGPNGKPFDSTYLRRFPDYLNKISPYRLTCALAENMINKRFSHKLYDIEPKHRLFSQHPMVNDALPNRILSGTVQMKNDIQEFTENGVIFVGDDQETKIDSVILATGYEMSFPFLDDSILYTKNNDVNLYKFMFNPKLRYPNTLCFVGLFQPVGPTFPISETQARWFCQLMLGNSKLPSERKMVQEVFKKRREIKNRYYEGSRHTVQVDWIPYLDEISSMFGAKPNVLKAFFTDPKLWWFLMFHPCYPYQYRLNGPGSWDGARDAIFGANDRIKAALRTRTGGKSDSKKKVSTKKSFDPNGNVVNEKIKHIIKA